MGSLDPRVIPLGSLDPRVIPLGSLDPRDDQLAQSGAPVEDLEEVEFNSEKSGKTFKIGRLLAEPL